jgi:hypothetical protein
MFSLDDVSVNGYMVDPFWATEVAAGKKSNNDVTFSSEAFEEIGIETADEIAFTLNVYDAVDWSKEYVEDSFAIYPTGLRAEKSSVRSGERRRRNRSSSTTTRSAS